MYNSYIVKRTQIYLDDDQARELAHRARVRGTTGSRMIREAIDQYLAEPNDTDERLARFRAAVKEASGTAPYLPDGAKYVDEFRGHDSDRDADLAKRADE